MKIEVTEAERDLLRTYRAEQQTKKLFEKRVELMELTLSSIVEEWFRVHRGEHMSFSTFIDVFHIPPALIEREVWECAAKLKSDISNLANVCGLGEG